MTLYGNATISFLYSRIIDRAIRYKRCAFDNLCGLQPPVHLTQEVEKGLGMMSITAANVVAGGATMRRDFADRNELIAYVHQEFPTAARIDDMASVVRGGRAAAEAALACIDPVAYAATRNRLTGAVTRLSPYLRHGVLSLAEVRDAALRAAQPPQAAAKLINELGWRDYFRRVYGALGGAIWRDQEQYKTGWSATDYADDLPADIPAGETGLACIDAFSRDLRKTGYLHNHARMWLAAYVVHFRRVKWQAGARWFLTHLLDGDPASNNLSWQWAASTFSHKPYIFNRENLEKYTDGVYCRGCPLRGRCDFEGSYAHITQRLFPRPASSDDAQADVSLRGVRKEDKPALSAVRLAKPVIWVHGDNLNPHSPAFTMFPGAPAVWVWDDALLERTHISLKRIVFLYECLLELPVLIRRGDVASEVLSFAAEQGADGVVTVESPAPGFVARLRQIEQRMSVVVLPEPPFVDAPTDLDLRRFTRYWRKVERFAMTPTRQPTAL